MSSAMESSNVRGAIYESLLKLKLIHPDTLTVFAERTRDVDDLKVFADTASGVIFIDDYYVGDDEYRSGKFRDLPKPGMDTPGRDLEDFLDTSRRMATFGRYLPNQSICDLGCGAGSFLKEARNFAKSVVGVELQERYREQLIAQGIPCVSDIGAVGHGLDCIFLFHSFEHFKDPLETLQQVHGHLKPDGGRVVIEVPHARDFLLTTMALPKFKQFTLWSQHLILHTRNSLEAFMRAAGFKNVVVSGVQRYSISNHIQWMKDGKPGGHKSNLAMLDNNEMTNAYSDTLSRLDANDTLVAVATT